MFHKQTIGFGERAKTSLGEDDGSLVACRRVNTALALLLTTRECLSENMFVFRV